MAPEWFHPLLHLIAASFKTLWSWSGLGPAAVCITALVFIWNLGEGTWNSYNARRSKSRRFKWDILMGEVSSAIKPTLRSRGTRVTVFAWVIFFGIALAVTVYRDHKNLKAKAEKSQAHPEAEDSLRRRTARLADEIQGFLKDRSGDHPPHTNGIAAATGGQAAINKASDRYDAETEKLCLSKFEDRTRGVVQELKAKGVDLGSDIYSGYFEATIEQHRCLDEHQAKLLRDLGYHLDGTDKLVAF